MTQLVPTNHTAVVPFDQLERQADVLAQSRIIPQAYRGRSADVIAAGLAGQAFGWDVMTSLRNYHVIEGTASLRPEAMLGLVRRAGHSVRLDVGYDEQVGRIATAVGTRADNGDQHTATFSEQDAAAAGLAKKKNWQQYLDAMLTWRAVSSLCRVLFPDVVLGAGYTPEEIGAEVTASGDIAEPDPFADPLLPIAEAKRRVLDACGGNKDEARRWWETQDELPSPEGMRESYLQRLLDRINGTDIIDADVVPTVALPDGHFACDRCAKPVSDGHGNYVEVNNMRVCHECDAHFCQACGAALEDGLTNALCDVCNNDSDDLLTLDGMS